MIKFEKNQVMKIGAKVLTPEQAQVILPSYHKIKDIIEGFRDAAQRIRKQKERADNTISILGERGSGKSSILMTYRKQHKSVNRQDITLNIIEPENMSDTNDSMGWLLDMLLKVVDQLEEGYAKLSSFAPGFDEQVYKQCIRKEPTKLRNSYNDLQKSYVIRKKLYSDMVYGRIEGQAWILRENGLMAQSDRSFYVHFYEFINQLVDFQKSVQSLEVEPMLLLFFDDVDISAERCPELLQNVLTYFSHPNIVVFVSGEYKVFAEAMTLFFLRKEQIPMEHYDTAFLSHLTSLLESTNDGEQTALISRQKRSHDYLKKVLPPSGRFEMRKLTNNEKCNFFHEGEGDESSITLLNLLERIGFDGKSLGNKMGKSLLAYMYIFDDNPRGLINPYYYMYQKEKSIDPKWNVLDLTLFLNILVNSSTKLSQYRNDLDKIIHISIREDEYGRPVLNPEDTYIDYEKMSIAYDRLIKNSKGDIGIDVKENLIVMSLYIDFAENLISLLYSPLQIMYKEENTLVQFLNTLHTDNDLFPETNNSQFVLDLMTRIFSVFNFESIGQIYTSPKLTEKFYQALSHMSSDDGARVKDPYRNLMRLFETTYAVDQEWVRAHLEYLFKKGSHIEDILRVNLSKIRDLSGSNPWVQKTFKLLQNQDVSSEVLKDDIVQMCSEIYEDLFSEYRSGNIVEREVVEEQIRYSFYYLNNKRLQTALEHEMEMLSQLQAQMTELEQNPLHVLRRKRANQMERLSLEEKSLKKYRDIWPVYRDGYTNANVFNEDPVAMFDARMYFSEDMFTDIQWSNIKRDPILFLYRSRGGDVIDDTVFDLVCERFTVSAACQTLRKNQLPDFDELMERHAELNEQVINLNRKIEYWNSKSFESDGPIMSEETLIELYMDLWMKELYQQLEDAQEHPFIIFEPEYWIDVERIISALKKQGEDEFELDEDELFSDGTLGLFVDSSDDEDYLNKIRRQSLHLLIDAVNGLYSYTKTLADYAKLEADYIYFRTIKQAFRDKYITSSLIKTKFQIFVRNLLKA